MSNKDYTQVLKESYDEGNHALKTVNLAQGLIKVQYDALTITNIPSGNGAGNPGTVLYKVGGQAGTTVATMTITYDVNNNPITVTVT